MTIDLVEYLIIGGRLPEAGARLRIADRWHELDCLLCHVVDAERGTGCNFSMEATLAKNGRQYLLLGGTPEEATDSQPGSITITHLLGADALEIISRRETASVIYACAGVMRCEPAERVLALKEFFGEFREAGDIK